MKRFLAVVSMVRELSSHHPDNSLPDGGEEPVGPDNALPSPPVGIWPSPGTPSHPIVTPPPGVVAPPIYITPPGQPSLPIYLPVGPDNALPGAPAAPDNTLPGTPAAPDNTLPKPPAAPTQPIYPPLLPSHPIVYPEGEFFILAYIPYLGWRYVKVDFGTRPGNALPDNTPQPK